MGVVLGGLGAVWDREWRQHWTWGLSLRASNRPLFPREPTSSSMMLGRSDWVSVAGGALEGDWLGAQGDRRGHYISPSASS